MYPGNEAPGRARTRALPARPRVPHPATGPGVRRAGRCRGRGPEDRGTPLESNSRYQPGMSEACRPDQPYRRSARILGAPPVAVNLPPGREDHWRSCVLTALTCADMSRYLFTTAVPRPTIARMAHTMITA